MKMEIRFISGINADRIKVIKTTDFGTHPYINEYVFGIDCSSHRNQNKPYIGEILADLVETSYLSTDDITYSGYNVFKGEEISENEVNKIFTRLFSEI